MSDTVKATIKDIDWMTGPWAGSLGPQSVTEEWRQSPGGVLSTMVTLCNDTGVDLIELIAICEEGSSLALHVRQFSSELELRYSDDLQLKACDDEAVRFRSPGAHIEELEYRLMPDQSMQVELTLGAGGVLAATLQRPAT